MTPAAGEMATAIFEAVQAGDVLRTDDGKDALAVALGRRGGLKGGKARAAALSSKRRREIAKKAATVRWAK
jgi:hypothetical protein